MRLFYFLIAAGLLLPFHLKAKDYLVVSPDGNITLSVRVDKAVTLTVACDDREVVSGLAPAMLLEGVRMPGNRPAVMRSITTRVREMLVPLVPHKNSMVPDNYNALSLRFRGGYSMEFRVYDDGVAYRFVTAMKEEVTVENEIFAFSMPAGTQALWPLEQGFMSHNECAFIPASTDTIGSEQLASLPTLFMIDGMNILLTEADIRDYPGMWLTGDGKGGVTGLFPAYPAAVKAHNDRNVYVTEREDYIARVSGIRTYPWRVFIITRDDAGLVESEMIYRLGAPPAAGSDFSWVRPGKVAWDWYNANNLFGVDFRAGLNNETYKYYIDFAAEYGIEYVILDEGWYNLGDVLVVAEGFDVEELCTYAAAKDVGIILWVVWKSFHDKIDEALAQYERWGVKGIKVDFMQRDDQWMVNYYHEVAAKAAEHRMLVDFHGCYKPDGMERQWPNVITREGVKGLENNKWSHDCNPEHDVTLPFTRMVAGPMDYTPGAMVNMQKRDFSPVFYRPASQGTRVHQMAMYVVYESPLQMLADSPSNYRRNAECTSFIVGTPVTWDQTEVVDAAVGDYIAVARRKVDTWYLGAMTDWDARTLEINLSFLAPGEYEMEIFSDGINADRHGEDYKHMTVKKHFPGTVTLNMAPGGGWVARITPAVN
ncbi:MAG: glycoside hydrolase family 97 protein [Bacteroidales bacterium]|nr:glycoside hydrolase family 97 protein [Bacteroidales bacterium]MDT8374370.1 glycoside hydrolase family 97 protein [Bacteroidales bacterium]